MSRASHADGASLDGMRTMVGTAPRDSVAPAASPEHEGTLDKVVTLAEMSSPTESVDSDGKPLGDRYQLIRELGEGGFARVWLAKDLKLGRQVAVKRLKAEAEKGPEGGLARKRFLQESQAIARLNHRNIVQVFDADSDAEGPYLVMEYIDGPTLREHLRQADRLDQAEALRLFQGIAQGVAFSHRHNIIHRDLKPTNILLAQDGGQFLPKIVDFGLARAGADSNVSLTGYGMGTMGYMPPEQRRDAKNVNHTADIYALGKILYELVSGAVPDNVLPNKIPPPPALARVIFKCIEDNPAERYFSVDELLGELSNLSGPSAELVAGSNLDANACPSCQAPNRHDAKFCERCGAGMMRPCPECERENRVSLPFCGGCGTDVSAFLAVQDIAQKMRAYAGEKKWTRIEKEYALLPKSTRLPGKKGGKLLAEVKSLKETATAKLRRLVELQETITAAVQRRHYETAAKAVVECLEIDPDNAVAAQARRELDQLEAQAAAVVAELNAAMEGKHWRQARQQADAAAKNFPQFGYISEVRQKALAAATEEKQRVAKFTEGLADATRLLQERRLVSCRRQVDDLLQLQGKLDVVDDPDCAKIMPAARERLAALAGDLQAAEAEAEELLAQAREKLSQGEDEACLLLCKSVQDRNAEDVECAGISAAAGEHFRALKGIKEQLRMANLYWVAGRVSEAEKAIKTVLAFQPEHAEATQLWQEIRNQRRQRRRHLAKMVLRSIVMALAAYALFVGYRFQHTRQQVKVHVTAARVAATQADWPAVMAAADKALALDEDNAEALECRKAAQIGVMAEVLRERLATATEAKDRGDWDAALATLGEDLHREPFPGAFQVEPLKDLLTRQSALKKDVETGKWGAAVAAVAAILRERLATAAAAQDRADWATALVALTAERPQEPFAGAFAAEPLRGLLQQLATLEKDIRAGQRAAQVEAFLAAARAAKAKKDWSAVLAAAGKALALDEDNVEAKALRAEASRHHLRVPDGFRLAPGAGPESYTNTGWAAAIIHEKSGIELVYIPAGTFTMGSPKSEQDAMVAAGLKREWVEVEIQHQVILSQGFYLGKTEVTQAQWEKVTGKNPSDFQNAGPTAPVENVSWDDCQAFCKEAGSGLRLPLEAEWEYACRAGTTTALYSGDIKIIGQNNAPVLDPIAWYGGNSGVTYEGAVDSSGWPKKQEDHKRAGTHPVGQKKPNAWGLYDMIGNVWEWCQDKSETYPAGPVTLKQPAGPAGREKDDGADRVVRGGGWYGIAGLCRSAFRPGDGPDYRYSYLGLRVACSAPPVQ